ncbi:KAP family NTPase [Pseudomonas maumuensis]|uniref:KAP family NTPase n=1 Tax=Pseudomonas maumuensis TaxID=2842354 RepID=A0ABX8NS52_9PSED|nr:KAP family NTPase [Pseudomonas maumuensis]QXH58791.1 KAP family NTPase [Pseudomonas maumuensis]
MDTEKQLSREDRPLTKLEDDALDRGPFVQSLVKALVNIEEKNGRRIIRGTGVVVGLTGEWGLGKSSVLNFLSEKLSQTDGIVVATLNPWLFKGREELLQAFFNSLREALGKSPKEKIGALRGQLARYKAAIEFTGTGVASVVDALTGTKIATGFWKKYLVKGLALLVKPTALSANEERKELEAKLAQANVAVVVLIDELDRVEDEDVRAIAQLVKAVGDIKGISYLVAYDGARVTEALGKGTTAEERRRTGGHYLEKIIQFAIPLRPLFGDEVQQLLKASLQSIGRPLQAASKNDQGVILQCVVSSIRTPRDIKRLVETYRVLANILEGEICPYQLLGYCWLVSKTPQLRDVMAEKFERLVDDPGKEERVRRSRRNDSPIVITEELGATAEAQAELLKLLFPRLSQRTSGGWQTGNLSKRSNLVRVLYLGDPPGMVTLSEVARLVDINDLSSMQEALRSLHDADLIPAVLDRLKDLFIEQRFPRHGVFWLAVSRVLERRHEWLRGVEDRAGLARSAADGLWQFFESGSLVQTQLKDIVENLTRGGDLQLVPRLLSHHFRAHGMFGWRQAKEARTFFSEEEISALLQKEMPRYGEAVRSGKLLKFIASPDLVRCLVESGKWGEDMRRSMTEQLSSIEALMTFAAWFLADNQYVEGIELDHVIDCKVVFAIIETLEKERGPLEEPWLQTMLSRLKTNMGQRVMAGEPS